MKIICENIWALSQCGADRQMALKLRLLYGFVRISISFPPLDATTSKPNSGIYELIAGSTASKM
jgi:hypothetical protein